MQVNLSVALKRRYEMEEEASHLRSQLFEAHDRERMVGGGSGRGFLGTLCGARYGEQGGRY